MVHAFGVFTECELHAHWFRDDHIVDAPPPSFDRRKLAANGVGASRADDHCGHARFQRFTKGAFHRIDAIDDAQVGGHRVGILVAVRALEAQPVLIQPEM